MLRKLLVPALLATLLTVLVSSQAQAWGGYHVGYTHVGYGGVYHYGRTGFYGGYGDRYGGYGGYRYGYRYGYGDRYGGYYGYHYSPSYYGNYGGVYTRPGYRIPY
jgi:hypothetical protein